MAYYITCEFCGAEYDSSWVAEFNGSPEEVRTCSATCSLKQSLRDAAGIISQNLQHARDTNAPAYVIETLTDLDNQARA